jgi:hypothetical protein
MARIRLLLVVLAGFSGALLLTGCGGTDLSLSPEMGETRVIAAEKQNEFVIELFEGLELTEIMEIRFELEATPVEERDGNVLIKAQFLNYEQSSEIMGANTFFTEDSLPEPLRDIFFLSKPDYSALKGIEFTFEVEPDGSISNVHNTRELVNALVATVSSRRKARAEHIMQARDRLEEEFGAEGIASGLAPLMTLPGGPKVSEDSEWAHSFERNLSMPMQTEGEFTVKRLTSSRASVESKETISTDPEGSLMPTGDAYLEGSLTGAGDYTVDPDSGWITEGRARYEGTMTVRPTNTSDGMAIDTVLLDSWTNRPK